MNWRKLSDRLGAKALLDRTRYLLERPMTAWSILAASLALTIVACVTADHYLRQRVRERFEYRVNSVTTAIEERLLEYEQVLRGGIGLFQASDEVSRDEWNRYVENCMLQEYFPGIQGMGVSRLIQPQDKSTFEEEIEAEGFDGFQIHPEGERSLFSAIVFLEPFDWRNQRAFGYDMYSEPTRRAAMDRSIRTGQPSMSGKVRLVQETDNDIQNGFLYYLPMFDRKEQSSDPNTRPDGFVYAAFRMNDLMDGILGESSRDIRFEIYDSEKIATDTLLYTSDNELPSDQEAPDAEFSTTVPLTVRGHTWTMLFESRPKFFSEVDNIQCFAIAAGGLVVDVLLFLTIGLLGQQKRHAVSMASAMTKEIRANESRLKTVLESASEAIITVKEDGFIELINDVGQRMFGMERSPGDQLKAQEFLADQTWESLVQGLAEPTKRNYTCTVDAIRRNGDRFPCRMTIARAESNGDVRYVIVAQDETDRLESERKLSEITQDFIVASRNADRVEVANGILHNVGNIVNSINVSTTEISRQVTDSAAAKLDRLCELVAGHEDDLPSFLTNDSKGQKLPEYLLRVNERIQSEKTDIENELQDLVSNVTHIKHVISSQLSAANTAEPVDPADLVADAITAHKATLANHNVQLLQDLESDLPTLLSDKHGILQIIINLIKNAYDSVVESRTSNPRIIIRATHNDDHVTFEVQDNGIGIPPEQVNQLFDHGFTTKKSGHGFGLHSSAALAEKLGGNLIATSDGLGLGANFRLTIPVTQGSLQPQVV